MEGEGVQHPFIVFWVHVTSLLFWPKWVGDDETKRQQYIHEYHEHEGILLEYDKIEYSAGFRAGQNDVEFHVWQVWATSQRDPQVVEFSDPTSLPSFPGYRHPECPSRVHHQRPPRESPLSTPRGRHPRVPQSQHLRGLFHHLLGALPNPQKLRVKP